MNVEPLHNSGRILLGTPTKNKFFLRQHYKFNLYDDHYGLLLKLMIVDVNYVDLTSWPFRGKSLWFWFVFHRTKRCFWQRVHTRLIQSGLVGLNQTGVVVALTTTGKVTSAAFYFRWSRPFYVLFHSKHLKIWLVKYMVIADLNADKLGVSDVRRTCPGICLWKGIHVIFINTNRSLIFTIKHSLERPQQATLGSDWHYSVQMTSV